jgi:hypothetical protein
VRADIHDGQEHKRSMQGPDTDDAALVSRPKERQPDREFCCGSMLSKRIGTDAEGISFDQGHLAIRRACLDVLKS